MNIEYKSSTDFSLANMIHVFCIISFIPLKYTFLSDNGSDFDTATHNRIPDTTSFRLSSEKGKEKYRICKIEKEERNRDKRGKGTEGQKRREEEEREENAESGRNISDL